MSDYYLTFSASWVDAARFEQALCTAGEPLDSSRRRSKITVPVGCRIMIDAGTRLLSLVNQIARQGGAVTLEFEEGLEGAMGYLDRMGFFGLLHPRVSVTPEPPARSASVGRKGRNPRLVELRPISLSMRDRNLPGELSDALEGACRNREDIGPLTNAAYTLFAELIDNIYAHSETLIDGYAALQVYEGGNRVIVSVSDSGHGILHTIRPSIEDQRLKDLSDPELIVHMFNHGLSRHGARHGCGLHQCADHALKFDARLSLRLPTSSLALVPGDGGYRPNMAYCQTQLPRMMGTHLAFNFRLDN